MKKETTPSSFWPAWGVLPLIVLLRVLPFLNPDGRFWGFNHLIFLSTPLTIIFFLVAAMALIIPFIAASEKLAEKLAGGVNNLFYEHRRAVWNRIILVLLAGIVFAIFVAPTHFLGDGYVIKANVALGERTIFKWTEVGSTLVVSTIARMLGDLYENTSLLAFQIISILSGVITLYFMVLIAGRISTRPLIRLLTLSAMMFSSILLLFFGYVEFYPILWPILTAFVWAGLRFLEDGKRLWLVWLFLIAGLGLHLIMAMLIPSAIYLTLASGRGRLFYEKHRWLVWAVLGAAIIVIIITFIRRLNNSLSFEDTFLPPFEGKPSSPEYFVFSLRHLVDILNQLLLVFPLLPLFIILAFGGLRKAIREKTAGFSILIALGFLAFLFVVDPKLGMPRDWDLFAMSAIGLILFLISATARVAVVTIKRMVVTVIIISLFCTVPYLITNLTESSSLAYAESLINYETSRAMTGLVVLSDYYEKEGRPDKIDVMRKLHGHKFQETGKIEAVINAFNKGDMKLVGALLRLLKPDKFNPDIYSVKARYELYFRHYDLALKHINNALELRPYYGSYYSARSLIYYAMGKVDLALRDLRVGYKLGPNSTAVVEGLTRIYADLNLFDSSSHYARELIALDSTDLIAYFALAKQGIMMRDSALLFENYGKLQKYADSTMDKMLLEQIDDLLTKNKRQ